MRHYYTRKQDGRYLGIANCIMNWPTFGFPRPEWMQRRMQEAHKLYRIHEHAQREDLYCMLGSHAYHFIVLDCWPQDLLEALRPAAWEQYRKDNAYMASASA